jgi:hypothetical protein
MISMPRFAQTTTQARHSEVEGSEEADEYATKDSWQKVLGFLKKALSKYEGSFLLI